MVVVCLAVLLLGAVLALRWGHLRFETPPPAAPVTFREQARRGFWYLDLLMIGGIGSGLLAAGAGGRLAMRLLAATAGDAAQGRITEADEVVGKITVGGTIGFVVFGGLFAGLLTAVVYLVVRRWLPPGRLGALALAGLLLVTLGAHVDPLRSNNPDFELVGPAWLAVGVFTALAILHAFVLLAVLARVSRSLPLFGATSRSALAYAPLVFLLPTAVFGVAVVLVMLAGAAVSTRPRARRIWAHPRTLLAGRTLVAAVALVSLPSFIGATADILTGRTGLTGPVRAARANEVSDLRAPLAAPGVPDGAGEDDDPGKDDERVPQDAADRGQHAGADQGGPRAAGDERDCRQHTDAGAG